MFRFRHTFLILLLVYSCKPKPKYNYAIKDFSSDLQPHLINIVSKGIVYSYDSAIHNIATDKDLVRLSKSEHPVLRAEAINEILERKSFDHYEFLMKNLDDTAVVAVSAGEFGIWYRSVSDKLIDGYVWDNKEKLTKTIDKVIKEHPYLRAAFVILLTIEPEEKYYPHIKDMVTKEKRSVGDYGDGWVHDLDMAMYGLAKFKKKEDVAIIKQKLLSQGWALSEVSFNIMKEFPDTGYMEVFETYYPRGFYSRMTLFDRHHEAEDFINSLVTYKNERAAKILETMLHKKPFINEYMPDDAFQLKHHLIKAIWENPCDAYAGLRKEIEPYMIRYEKELIQLPPLAQEAQVADTSKFQFTWFR